MLYQFSRPDGPVLGKSTVNAIAPLLPNIAASTWLAAMGVDHGSKADPLLIDGVAVQA